MATPIKLALPRVVLSDDSFTTEHLLECYSDNLTFGSVVDDATASFCNPDGVGEPYFEVNVKTSYEWLNSILDLGAGTLVDCEIVADREAAYPSATNWKWAGKVKMPVLETVLDADIRGYSNTRVRFESDGNVWQVDKGAGLVDVSGWRA